MGIPEGWGFPDGASNKELICQCSIHNRRGFDPWFRKIPQSMAWQPTSVFLPGESKGQRSLVGYSPYSCKESDTTEATQHTSTRRIKSLYKSLCDLAVKTNQILQYKLKQIINYLLKQDYANQENPLELCPQKTNSMTWQRKQQRNLSPLKNYFTPHKVKSCHLKLFQQNFFQLSSFMLHVYYSFSLKYNQVEIF